VPTRTARSKPFVDQVHDPIRHRQIEGDLGVAGSERSDRGRDPLLGDAVRRRQTNPAARDGSGLAGQRLGLGQVGEQRNTAFIESLPGFGQRQPTRGPVQQPRTQVLLEVRDVTRQRRGRPTELLGGPHEAAALDHAYIGFERCESIHCCLNRDN
jgi:hypothetical protein